MKEDAQVPSVVQSQQTEVTEAQAVWEKENFLNNSSINW